MMIDPILINSMTNDDNRAATNTIAAASKEKSCLRHRSLSVSMNKRKKKKKDNQEMPQNAPQTAQQHKSNTRRLKEMTATATNGGPSGSSSTSGYAIQFYQPDGQSSINRSIAQFVNLQASSSLPYDDLLSNVDANIIRNRSSSRDSKLFNLMCHDHQALSKMTPPSQTENRGNKRRRKREGRRLFDGFNPKILLVLFFLLSVLPNCLVLLFKLPNIKTALASTSKIELGGANSFYYNNHRHNNHHHNADDGDPDPPSSVTHLPDDMSYNTASGDTENFTPRIPFEQNKFTATSNLLPSTTTQRPPAPQAASRRAPETRVTESEVLPFAEFNVQQPTFSDLIKSWPPTTRQQVAHLASSDNQMPTYAVGSRQNPRVLAKLDEYSDADSILMRNYLNEDLDDTMVTADQGFERDQVAEPPTMVNYLGDLGDYIYLQLRQYFDGSGGGASGSRQGQDNDGDRQPQQANGKAEQQVKIEAIDELLDDHYYDQYENSQVLYYGPQLVREGDIFEIGCYLPYDQRAEWTKSGKILANSSSSGGGGGGVVLSPRVFRRGDFLGAKQNYSLKVFEASLSDSGNYRCNRLSRKYHKLVVVPFKTTTTQLFLIQQRLLSVVNPKLVSMPSLLVGSGSARSGSGQIQRYYGPTTSSSRQSTNRTATKQSSSSSPSRDLFLLPGHLIIENQPLVVNCNISDEFVLRRLAENPKFQLAWYKNGKQLKGSFSSSSSSPASQFSAATNLAYQNQSPATPPQPGTIQVQVSPKQAQVGQQHHQQLQATRARQQQQQQTPTYQTRPQANNQRIQFLQANGRQLYITSALYSDAGDYLCSWSKLPQSQHPSSGYSADGENGDLTNSEESHQRQHQSTIASNPLAAGSLVQLLAPVKLRPFKSTYHARAGNELRLVCQVQRGYPPAHISWYVGNRLVDGEFLREHGDEFRVLQLQNQNQLIVTSASGSGGALEQQEGGAGSGSGSGTQLDSGGGGKQIIEINPIPSGRQQMSLTADGRGQWIEYRDQKNEKYAIETPEQQLRYLKQKLAQLTGFSGTTTTPTSSAPSQASSSSAPMAAAAGGQAQASPSLAGDPQAAALFSQTSISVLVINSLDIDRHTARYACRATTRTNTDEATTVIRVQASSLVVIRPTSGRATLVPGKPLHFQCEMIGNKDAEFLWYKLPLGQDQEVLMEPNNDDYVLIHNERFTLLKPTLDMAGDYFCRAIKADDKREFGSIKVRTQPYIEDFGHLTSHTGKSSTITDGDRLELLCSVRDKLTPVNITWLRSQTPDDDRNMVPLLEVQKASSSSSSSSPLAASADNFPPTNHQWGDDQYIKTFMAQEQSIIIETVDKHSKRLVIESIKPEHRSHYGCIVDNGVTERTRKVIFIRVKDKLVALWPFLGIVAELFILFTIIHVWETQRAYREMLFAQQSENRLLQ